MPWKVQPMSEIRAAFVHQVLSLNVSVAQAARNFDISRKTAYKWLGRYREHPDTPLIDLSRKPRSSPSRTDLQLESQVIDVRRQFGWGARKVHAYLRNQGLTALPSVRTVNQILGRHGCLLPPQSTSPAPVQFFERAKPHELWQCDFKGPLEIQRQKIHPFTVLDDHSRFLIACRPCTDLTMKTAFNVLWDAFGEFGLPECILSDNSFGTTFDVPKTLSWFEAQLVRLGIHFTHGKPYHPQTQGKVERLHRTLEDEVWPFVRRDSLEHFDSDVNRWRTEVYNTIRPHEALGDLPPLTRFRPSPRPRPPALPAVEYPSDAVLRKVSSSGDIRWKCFRILAGRGLVGQWVRIEDRDHEVLVFYSWKQVRCIARDQLRPDTML